MKALLTIGFRPLGRIGYEKRIKSTDSSGLMRNRSEFKNGELTTQRDPSELSPETPSLSVANAGLRSVSASVASGLSLALRKRIVRKFSIEHDARAYEKMNLRENFLTRRPIVSIGKIRKMRCI